MSQGELQGVFRGLGGQTRAARDFGGMLGGTFGSEVNLGLYGF